MIEDGFAEVAFMIVFLWIIILLLECIASDLIQAIIFAIPFFITYLIVMNFYYILTEPVQILISTLAIINVIVIWVNLLKNLTS